MSNATDQVSVKGEKFNPNMGFCHVTVRSLVTL